MISKGANNTCWRLVRKSLEVAPHCKVRIMRADCLLLFQVNEVILTEQRLWLREREL